MMQENPLESYRGLAVNGHGSEPLSWSETFCELDLMKKAMDAVHERYPGKENRMERERELRPLQKRCVEIGEIRYSLARPSLPGQPPRTGEVEIPEIAHRRGLSHPNKIEPGACSEPPPVSRVTTLTESNVMISFSNAEPVPFKALWLGDRFVLLGQQALVWSKLGPDTARRHSIESIALAQRGYGYLGDAICYIDPEELVLFEPITRVAPDLAGEPAPALDASAQLVENPEDSTQQLQLQNLAKNCGWREERGGQSIYEFLGRKLRSSIVAATCQSAPSNSNALWGCYDCGFTGLRFKTLVQGESAFESECPSCGSQNVEEATTVVRELVATVEGLRELTSNKFASGIPVRF